MKSRIAVFLSILLSLWAANARAADNAAVAPVAQAPSPAQRGILYRVSRQGHTAYLFGTVHAGRPDFFPLSTRVTEALAHCRKLVLELDVRDNAAFQRALQKHGMYPDAETIAAHLSGDSLARLQQALQSADIPFANVRHMKPWLVANLLIGLDLERHGLRRADGIEMRLLSLATLQAKPVGELESAEYQMALYDGMSDAEQERYLRESLADLVDGNAFKKAQAMIDAWADANDAALETFLRESLQEKSASAEFTQRVLLDQRNPQMADKIEALLREDESAFIGVGLLHLVGASGLPGLLRARGYAVEKLH